MPVLAKFYGIVIRVLFHRTFGIHVHAIYGDAEMVIALNPTRVIQGEVPDWVKVCALSWVRDHLKEIPVASEFGGRACLRCVGGHRAVAPGSAPADSRSRLPAPRVSLTVAG